MPFPRALPSVRSVEDDFKITAAWVNRFLYFGIVSYTVVTLFDMIRNGPSMAEEQLPQWGSMPRLTLCLDNSSSTFVESVGFVALGFGHRSAENALSGDCTQSDISGYTDSSRWVDGAALEGTNGRCHRLNLTGLSPFAKGTPVNNLMIGGIADYRGGLLPKFISVSSVEDENQGATQTTPLLYLYPQRFLLDELGRPRRIQSPSYDLEKERVPQTPLPWLFNSKQREHYSVRNMGLWKSCVPLRFQEGIKAGQIVFGFGLFVTSPTIKSVYSKGMIWQILQLIGSVGGWCGISLIIWRCVFVRRSRPSEQELHTLHPSLKGAHATVTSAVQQSLEGFLPSASARELEEPLVI